jgi:hypothetical protein
MKKRQSGSLGHFPTTRTTIGKIKRLKIRMNYLEVYIFGMDLAMPAISRYLHYSFQL